MKRKTYSVFRILTLIIVTLLACEDNKDPLSSSSFGEVEIIAVFPSEKPDEKVSNPRLLTHIDIDSVNVQITPPGINDGT